MNGLSSLFQDSAIQILKEKGISDDLNLVLFIQGMRREGPAELLNYLKPEDLVVMSSDLLSFYSVVSEQYLIDVVPLKTSSQQLSAELNTFVVNGRYIYVISLTVKRTDPQFDGNIQLLNIFLKLKISFHGFIVSDAIMDGVPSYSGVHAMVDNGEELGFQYITFLRSAFERSDCNFFGQEH